MKKILILLCLTAGLHAADIGAQLKINLEFHRKFYAAKKNLKKAPAPITVEGKFKMTGDGDLFSRAMDTWGVKLLSARSVDEALGLLPAIETWAKTEKAKALRMEKVLSGLVAALPKSRIGAGKKLPGEFGLFLGLAASGKDAPLQGTVRRMLDLDRWLILNLEWVLRHVELIRKYEKEFRDGWSGLLVHGTLFGTSLVQRLYDIGEIQVLVDDLMYLTEAERVLFRQQQDTPHTLGAEQRAFYVLLKKAIPDAALQRLDDLLARDYDLSYVNAQFRRYQTSPKGAAFCAEKLGRAVTALHGRDPAFKEIALAELLNYRQGEIYCGYKPDTRFHDLVFSISPLWDQKDIQSAARKAVKDFHGYYKKNLKYGQSKDIEESFRIKRADCFRMANFAGAALANHGFTGLFPMRRRNHSFVGLQAGDTIITCDPIGGRLPGKTFPDQYVKRGDTVVECYTRTIGGWITVQALVRPQDPIVELKIPYLRRAEAPAEPQKKPVRP